ncbi:ABC transporter ATP-binding protein [uncultured Roseobacter sp.]|uniref:ABC transporter ATP-binding protein n=1 Tax=uncultured Roseobacter sp. TaxID=114847 RepID=UPI0026069127|nr:ABC transporter ATP-binding protein [uncultured Roseobacter sp.]
MKLSAKPRSITRTGDDTAAHSLMVYVWRMSEWHQPAVCLLAVLVAVLNLIPLELQRRIVNEVVETRDVSRLVTFGAAYAGIILLHQAVKYALWMYQSWLTESATLYTRRHLLTLYEKDKTDSGDGSGRAVSIVGAEVEKLGGFVGEGLSGACANAAMLIGVAAYMFVVEPKIAIFALAFLIPQVLLTPFLQKRLNILIEERVRMLRDLGDTISGKGSEIEDTGKGILDDIFGNRMRYFVLKFLLKSLLNLLNALGPITVLLFGGYLVMQGEVQLGVIVAFLSGFDRISSPLRELIGFYRVAAQANVQHGMIAKWMSARTGSPGSATRAPAD